jgi:hypothetical protein
VDDIPPETIQLVRPGRLRVLLDERATLGVDARDDTTKRRRHDLLLM